MIQALSLTAVLLATAAFAAPRQAARPAKGKPAPDSAGWVTGRVLLAGKPATGARIFFYWADPASRGWREAQAGPGGEFRFAVKPNQRQNVALVASGPGGEVDWAVAQRFDQAPPTRRTPLKLELQKPATLTGRVLTQDGAPAAGVQVRLAGVRPLRPGWPEETELLPPAWLGKLQATTAASGEFRVEGVPAATAATLILPEYADPRASPARLAVPAPGEQPAGILVAARPHVLTLTAVRDGKPAAGDTVWLRPLGAAPQGRIGAILAQRSGKAGAGFRPVELDREGTARERLAPGRYELAFHGKVEPVEISGDAAVRLTTRGAALKGTVRDEEGKPASGARVTVTLEPSRQPWPPAGEPASSSPDGAFELPDFPWEASAVTVRARLGLSEGVWTGNPAALQEPLSLTLKKIPALTVRGRIVAGKPLADARVALFARETGGGVKTFGTGKADAEGRFSILGLLRGVAFQVGALGTGQTQLLESRPLTAPEAGETLDLGDVPVEGRAAPSPALSYLPMALPSPKDEEAARDALAAYLQALRSGDAAGAHRLTSALDPNFDPRLERFLPTSRLVLPGSMARLGRDDLYPMRLYPSLLLAGIYDVGPDVGAPELVEAMRSPDWVPIAVRSGEVVRRIALMHREGGVWKLLGGLSVDEAGGINAAAGDHALLGAAYPQPESGPVLEAGRAFLKAWVEDDTATLHRLAATTAPEYQKDPQAFAERWKGRLVSRAPMDRVPEFQVESRFTEWDLALLFSYPSILHSLHTGRAEFPKPSLKAFPYPEIRDRSLAVLSYSGPDTRYLMLLARQNGQWRVLDPALPAGALR